MSTVFAILMMPFRPAAAARKLGEVPLSRTYLHHLAASLVAVATVVLLVASYEPSFGLVMGESLLLLDSFTTALRERPVPLLFSVGLTVLAVEMFFVLLGVVFASWGARHEPVKESIRNSLRFVWLNTWHLSLAITLAGGLIVSLSFARMSYQTTHPVPRPRAELPSLPTLSPTHPEFQAAQVAYNRDLQQFWNEHGRLHRAWQRAGPFYVAHGEQIGVVGCFAAGLWTLYALLRAIGARPPTDIEVISPRCDHCGYDLSVTPKDSNCPECGLPVVDSIGHDARPGALWSRCNPIAGAPWPRWAWNAIRTPEALGRKLRLYPGHNDHRTFLAVSLIPAFFLGAFGVIAAFVVSERRNPLQFEPQVVFGIGPAIGCLCVAGTTVLACLAATTVGLLVGRSVRRNLLPGAIQVACYQSGYTVLWILFGGLWFGAILNLQREKVFETLAAQSRLSWPAMMFWAYVLPNVVWFLIYFVLVYRGTRAMRFANR